MAMTSEATTTNPAYLFRHNDPELWAKFTERAEADGLPVSVVLRLLVAAYTDERIEVTARQRRRKGGVK